MYLQPYPLCCGAQILVGFYPYRNYVDKSTDMNNFMDDLKKIPRQHTYAPICYENFLLQIKYFTPHLINGNIYAIISKQQNSVEIRGWLEKVGFKVFHESKGGYGNHLYHLIADKKDIYESVKNVENLVYKYILENKRFP